MKPHPLLVQGAMMTTMLLWGVSFVASKIILDQITPLTYMGVRFLAASVLLAGVMAIRGRPRFSLRTVLLIGLTALAEPIAYFLFESYGIRLLSATTASLIIGTIPLAVTVLAAIILNEPARPGGLVAVGVSIVGIVLLVIGDGVAPADLRSETIGILLIFGAVFSAAFYITLARGLTQHHDPINLTVVQTWWGAGVFLILWRAQPPEFRSLAAVTPVGWGALAFLVAGATVAAFLLYNWALRYERAGVAALYINAIPVITAITGWIVLGERLTPVQMLGAILVLASVRVGSRSGGDAGHAPPPRAEEAS